MASITLNGLLWLLLISLPFISALMSHSKQGWRIAETLSMTSFLLALVGWIALIPLNISFTTSDWLAITPLRITLLLLVSFIGLIVLRYSRTNFIADPDNQHFLRWLTLTLFAVMITITSNHLVVFWLAWVAISLSMHQLLVFYPSRYRAVLAAHKKFIFARSAELCLAGAFFLLYNHHHTLLISDILSSYSTATLSWQEQMAAFLIAIVALIKCAQLPVHGWLIQVVESPTPVSALLHAGVINLGGFLILLFAPLFSQALAAQWLILIIAGLTAAFAALVMITRISEKVRLAWSTTAQMGLMLVECALGLYELALLHLVAHSCYKAHAFLKAGSAVSENIQHQYSGTSTISARSWLFAMTASALMILILSQFIPVHLPLSPWILLAIALTISLTVRANQSITYAVLNSVFDATVLTLCYAASKTIAQQLVPEFIHAYSWLADAWISGLFASILLIYLFLQYKPSNPYAKKLFIALNAGFYLDEWSTRITLRLWPIQLPKNLSTHPLAHSNY